MQHIDPLIKIPRQVTDPVETWNYYGVDHDLYSIAFMSKEYGNRGHWLNVNVRPQPSTRFREMESFFFADSQPRGVHTYSLTLSQIFDGFGLETVDVLAMDIEGIEVEVLEQHDWKVAPHFIAVEIHSYEPNCGRERIMGCLEQQGYELMSETPTNVNSKYPTLEAKFIKTSF